MNPAPLKLLLVDDQDLIRESLHIVLGMDPDIEVVGLAENGHIAIQQCEEHQPDVVLMDIHMPVMDGVEATRKIKETWPQIRVIILTTFQEISYVVDALGAGAEGYLLKAIHPKDLAAGIKWVHQGGTLIPQDIARMLVQQAKGAAEPTVRDTEVSRPAREEPARTDAYGLSEREVQVLHCIADGLNNREIAEKLFLSEGTVKNYISSIYSKMDVRDRVQASKKAHEEGMI
ncbi:MULTISPECIES: response regulator transcription factor [Paenibacillus]|uniref:Response regulator transcription factor n=1 Tax=Paenibacillus violae TaxID=3077234 RepID=A0ABU3RH77_9BACL|nr:MULTISPECIES: response regulator transcription factor [Paenibacillus]MDU0203640.1 response regulator transcription factor [Paenibacillus sp. PFR10]MEC0270625.1 response regulator transcription factor [Paenibacillus anseongense]